MGVAGKVFACVVFDSFHIIKIMVLLYKNFDLEAKLLVEREFVDRFYLKNKGDIPRINKVEVLVKLHTGAIRHSNLFEIVRYVKLVELITGQFPLVSLSRSRRKSWIELKVTLRRVKFGFLMFLLNKSWSKKKELDNYLSIGNFRGDDNGLDFRINKLKFFDFLGKYQVVDEKLLAYWNITISAENSLKLRRGALYFGVYNCTRDF